MEDVAALGRLRRVAPRNDKGKIDTLSRRSSAITGDLAAKPSIKARKILIIHYQASSTHDRAFPLEV